MTVPPLARTVLRLEYTAVRVPLSAFDTYVASRLPQNSPVRATLARGLSALDAVAERLLHDDRETAHDARNDEPAGATVTATVPDSTVDDTDTDTDTDTAQDTAQDSEDAAAERERIAEVILEEEHTERHVGELAEADEDELEDLAELRAKHQQAEEHERREAQARREAAARHDAGERP